MENFSEPKNSSQLVFNAQYYLGPVRDPLYVVIPISIIYASIFMTGTVGNISTCIVIARNKSMHTATNYYLFSLAISDLLLLVCGMPTEIYQVWFKYPYVFGEAFCVLQGLASETSTNASVLIITAFTAERYVAICHPFLSQTMSKLSRAVKLILVIWLIALICAMPQALQFGIVQSKYIAEDVRCQVVRIIVKHSFELSTFLFFVVPMTVIMVLYILIGLKLKRSTMISNCRQPHRRAQRTKVKVSGSRMDRHSRHSRSTRRVLKMLVAVVVAFFICWAPFHMQRLIAIYGETQKSSRSHWIERLYVIFTYGSGVFYYFSTTINPILYNIMSNKFREAFMETLAHSCRMTRLVLPRERRSYSSLSQQHNPGPCPSRTIGMSSGTVMAQESTDCSGNSYREEQPEVRRSSGIVDFASPKISPPLMYDTTDKQSSGRGVLTIDVATKCPHFIEIRRQQQAESQLGCLELPSPEYDGCARIQDSPTKSVHQCNAGNCSTKSSSSSKKKWWRLLNWLPGLKSFRTSRILARSAQDALDFEQRPPKGQDEYFLQLHTFKLKEETCRPV